MRKINKTSFKRLFIHYVKYDLLIRLTAAIKKPAVSFPQKSFPKRNFPAAHARGTSHKLIGTFLALPKARHSGKKSNSVASSSFRWHNPDSEKRDFAYHWAGKLPTQRPSIEHPIHSRYQSSECRTSFRHHIAASTTRNLTHDLFAMSYQQLSMQSSR